MLKDLIETNIRQRGMGNPNPVKFGRCLVALERIYGVRQGSQNPKGVNQHIVGDQDNLALIKTQGEPV